MQENKIQRRNFLKTTALAAAGTLVVPEILSSCSPSKKMTSKTEKELFFKISLAEWSLHKTIHAGKMTNMDFPAKAKNDFGIEAIEYVNSFFKDKAKDKKYLSELKKRCDDLGVKSLLIMCDGEGWLGDSEVAKRREAVENHYKWVEAAKFLGCHSIRVNAGGQGTAEEVAANAVDGLRKLTEFGVQHGINVIVENHGSYSSNGKWLSDVIKRVGMRECGTLPDFGNFCMKWKGSDYGECAEMYDRYLGITEFMPYAKAVSAKSNNFDSAGNCTETDYRKMLKIVKDAGYRGYIGIEYEGAKLSEDEGIRATQALLKKVGAELS